MGIKPESDALSTAWLRRNGACKTLGGRVFLRPIAAPALTGGRITMRSRPKWRGGSENE